MIYLKLYNKYLNSDAGHSVLVNSFETCYRTNIMLGDSGSGKTLFIENLRRALDKINGWYVESNVEIIVYPYNTSLNEIQQKKNCLIVIDEGEADKLNKDNHKLGKLLKTPNYFLILDRDKIRTGVNVNAIWKLQERVNEYNSDFRLFNTVSNFSLKRVHLD